ncbi:MAG TPA: hypothetical protein VH912_11235 [Streptosporangiaceae bacterium]|jgi:hypothetical protein
MSHTPDVPSRNESLWIATAAATQGPWGLAFAGGAVIGGAQMALQLLGGHLTVAGPLAAGLVAFFLIGSIGALLGKSRDRARAWAHRHPWRYGVAPAIGVGATVLPVKLLLSGAGPIGATFDALWTALSVLVIVGLVGMVVGAVRRDA